MLVLTLSTSGRQASRRQSGQSSALRSLGLLGMTGLEFGPPFCMGLLHPIVSGIQRCACRADMSFTKLPANHSDCARGEYSILHGTFRSYKEAAGGATDNHMQSCAGTSCDVPNQPC